MAGILKTTDGEFKTTMINMLITSIAKVNSMQSQMYNVSKEKNARDEKHCNRNKRVPVICA
jgi:hypothetical protein